uniref:Uncharacterized protein n=1 Tax=Aegilops tauschii subsp. strangulata TaxID=200361 RepID=A0A453QIQ3_AEGTS
MLSSLRYLAGSAGPSGYGSRTTADEATLPAGDLSHITAIVTGATSGIGAETARVLARRGARLVLPARNLKAAEETRARILADLGDAGSGGGRVVVLPLDLSSLASVRRFVHRFLALRLKQRGAVRGAVRGVGGRRGDDLRHQLPGPLPAHGAASARHGGHGQGHRRAGPRRERLLHRARLVRRRRRRRRAPRLPPPRHPQGHAVRSDAGLRAVQARQRAPHHGPRRPAQGDGRRRHRQLRPPRHRPHPPHPRPRRPRHQHGVLPGVQAPQDGPPGGGDDVLRGGAPGGGGGVGEVLRRLQRGGAVEVGVQRRGGLQAVELLRGHHRREGEGGECSSRHQLQVSGPELQRRPRHGHC